MKLTKDEKARVADFFKYIVARQQAWYNKEVLGMVPPDHSVDKVIARCKMGNVFRELDRGTRFVYEAMTPFSDSYNQFVKVLIYRLSNSRLFYDNAVRSIDFKKESWKEWLERFTDEYIASKRGMIFRRVYMTAHHQQGVPRHRQMIEMIENAIVMDIPKTLRLSRSGNEAMEQLQRVPQLGPFVAYQIVLDLVSTQSDEGTYFRHNFTEDNFTVLGSGAKRGVKRIFPNQVPKLHHIEWLRDHQEPFLLTDKWEKIRYPKSVFPGPLLSLSNIEFSLCEYDKYKRFSTGVAISSSGKVKSRVHFPKYVPSEGWYDHETK